MGTEIAEVRSAGRKRLDRPGLGMLAGLVLLAWAIELIDQATSRNLDNYGILPRSFIGLRGVVLSPWLHGSWGHLIANTITFFGLGMIVIVAEGRRFISTTFMLVLLSGLGTWVIGRPAVHIGASGLIYGYFGYILGRALWEKKVIWAMIGIVVGVIYWRMLWGVIPKGGIISWEGHLAGLIGGVWLGKQHAGRKRSS